MTTIETPDRKKKRGGRYRVVIEYRGRTLLGFEMDENELKQGSIYQKMVNMVLRNTGDRDEPRTGRLKG